MSSAKKTPKAPTTVVPPATGTAPTTALTTTYVLSKVPTKKALDMVNGAEAVVATPGPTLTIDEIVEAMPESISEMGMKGRGMILGVSPVLVFKSFLVHLIGARVEGNPAPLVYCGVLAVAVAYTVSRDWIEEYGEIPGPHMFTEYEITGRAKVKATEKTAAVEWVADSNMNAAALRVFGSMIVEAGQSNGFLKHVKETAGTMFFPPEGQKERDEIMREANKSLSEADRIAMEQFKLMFTKYAQVVGSIFGGGDVDFMPYVDVAQALGDATI